MTYRKVPGQRFYPRPCKICGEIFQPLTARDRHCAQCKQLRERWKEDVVGALLRSAGQRKSHTFGLSRVWFEAQWIRQSGRCALSGMQMTRDRSQGAGNLYDAAGTKVSIDRIDPSGGYTPENSRLVCVVANLMRHRLDDASLLIWCSRILEHNGRAFTVFEGGPA